MNLRNELFHLYFRMELGDDYRHGPEIEPDSDVDDPESESQLSQWLGELENYAKVSCFPIIQHLGNFV